MTAHKLQKVLLRRLAVCRVVYHSILMETGRERRDRKRWISNRDDHSLEMSVENLGELHKE